MENIDINSLALSSELIAVLKELGFSDLTPIQQQSIPPLLQGRDLIGQSRTGSGKTAAFALPILEKIDLKLRSVQALIICPTRELASQVVTEVRKLGRKQEGLQVVSLVGGVPGREQAATLANGVHIAVGTPGRIIDLIDRNRMDLNDIKTVVLDEADKMLEMGFEAEIRAIMQILPQPRQTVLFSATFPESILGLSKSYQKNPLHIVIETENEESTIEQVAYDSAPHEKANTLLRILQQHPANSSLIFCNTKATVNELAERFASQKISCAVLHGDLEQRDREKVMTLFRNSSYRILIATDVAARGLDIENLDLVVNFDLPDLAETYLHRIGRTGRAGGKGIAVSITDPRDTLKLLEFEKISRGKIKRPVLRFENQHGLQRDLKEAPMQTLSISGGRKDKLRPGDILGSLTKDVGLSGADIGKIEIQDKYSYVAVASAQVEKALAGLRQAKIKGQKFQIKLLK